MSAPVVAVVVVAASIVSLVFGLAFCERLHVYIAASTDCDDGDADWGLGLRLRLRLLVGLGPENGGDCDWADGRTHRGTEYWSIRLLFLMLTRLKIIDSPCRRSMSTLPRHRSTTSRAAKRQ